MTPFWILMLAAIEGIDGLPASAIPQLTGVTSRSTTEAGNASVSLFWRCTNVDDVNYRVKVYKVDPGHPLNDPLYIPQDDELLATKLCSAIEHEYDTGVPVGETPWLFTFKFRLDVVHIASGDVADSEEITASWVG